VGGGIHLFILAAGVGMGAGGAVYQTSLVITTPGGGLVNRVSFSGGLINDPEFSGNEG
jgi:hypothetical protein